MTERKVLFASRRDNLSGLKQFAKIYYVTYESVDRLWPRAKNLCDHEQGPRCHPRQSWRVDENDQGIRRLPANARARSLTLNSTRCFKDRCTKDKDDVRPEKSHTRRRHHRSWNNWHCRRRPPFGARSEAAGIEKGPLRRACHSRIGSCQRLHTVETRGG